MDQIRLLLLTTGWSCDELIKNVQEYKLKLDEDTNQLNNLPTPNSDHSESITDNFEENNSHHRISFVEVENDHSYTSRKASTEDCQLQTKVDRSKIKPCNEIYIKKYFKTKNRKYVKRINFPRIFKNRYRLQRTYSLTDRKMLICKYKSKEFVRNEITHQLELLRSKKAFGISSDIRQPMTEQIVSKKRYSGSKNKDEGCCSKDGLVYEEACDISPSNYENPCSPEVEIGNVNEIEPEINKEDACIKPSKTNDITKIKGWKRKFTTLYKTKYSAHEHLSSKTQEISNENGILENKLQPEIRTDTKSAFASTNLDGFLHDSANLHISFEIPTLDSGNNDSTTTASNKPESQPIQNIASTSISPQLNGEDELLKVVKIDTLNLYRPRTLGQKRRIWKLKADNRLKRKIEDVAKPRTLAEKRRMLDNDTEIKVKSKVETNNGGSGTKYSYVLHRGKKLRIPTRTENGIIAYIKSHYGKRDYIYVPRKLRQNKMKPSIFATTPITATQVVRYRPGPLSKKTILQEYNKEWKTELKQLPKIYLQVTPQLNKPIAPYITHLLPQYDFELTHERISFALAALNFKNQSRTFTFPLSYANKQECLLLRRRINPSEEVPPEVVKTEDSKSVEDTVQDVIDKMLDYVEIKSISEEVLRDDVTEMMMREEKTNVGEQQNNVSKKRKTKQSKTNYELKRLNVKVIEVNLEDKEKDDDDCKKPFCRLGCLCKSLSTTSSLVSNHCGIPDCMFECKCNYEKKSKGNLKVTLPIGTDLLSEGAVNRLEVEAKKNLARVEKEFTQTVIQANNQTIVVGGCTNRQRRVTKLPKKYNDYIDDSDNNNDPVQTEADVSDETRQEEVKLKHWKPVPCTVFMSKLNLDQVIPYCMVHNLYDCYCEFKSLYETKEEKEKDDKEKKSVEEPGNLKLTDKAYDIWFKDGSFNYDILEWDSCARTKGLPTDYYHIRNKSEKFVKIRRRRLDKMYKYNHSTHQYIHCGIDIQDSVIHVTDEPEPRGNEQITNPTSNNINVISSEKRTRRKQSLLIRRDTSPIIHPKLAESSDNAIQRRKKQKKYLSNILDRPLLPKDADQKDEHEKKVNKYEEQMKRLDLEQRIAKFEQIFQTMRTPSTANLFTPSSLIQQKLTEILGKNIGGDVQFRLIPWDILVTKYESSSLQLWHSTYFKKPRIIATDNNTIPKHFVNVRNYENISNKEKIKADVIRWLVTKQVPVSNSKENIFVIVQLTKTHCELCGLWEKKQNNQSDKMVLISQPYAENRMYSIVKKIMFSKCKFGKQMLFDPNVSDDAKKIPAVSAYLPQISSNSKWRMIKLNSDFSVLSLHRNKYAIKYSDLQKVMKMAKETGFTIVLKTSEVETNYPHPDFGMYASPDCEDIIFIGPYYHNEDHDITTLRYANRELIRTEVFCKMRGQTPACSGVWLYQLSITPPAVDNLQTIDLTECESDHESKKRREISAASTSPLTTNTESVLICDKQKTIPTKKNRKSKNPPLITSTDLLKYESNADDYTVRPIFYMFMPEEAGSNNFSAESKVYFVPNVPKMGYIVGYRKPDQVIIFWPSLKYVVNFPNVSEAIMYIQRELNSCFIKSPSFQIFVDVEFDVENSEIEIFNWDLLKGYYIVSPSGVIPLLEVTKSTLKLLNLTLEEVENLAKLVAQRKIFDKCYELARKLFRPSKVGKPKNTSEILEMIMSEIKHQEAIEHKLLICQSKLTDKRQSLRLQCTAVIKELQPLVNEKMQKAMRKILSFNKDLVEKSTKSNGNDVICLDGDSEEDNSKDNCTTNTEEELVSTSTTTSNTNFPFIPKISVKRIQDLKEPSGSTSKTHGSSKTLSVKSFSILKNKTSSTETSSTGVNSKSTHSDSSVTLTQADTSLIMRPPDNSVSTNNCKTFTIKRSILNKKCSKFVIKTSNGKYMTIRAEDLKELPVKKLQPIAPNDPVISKLSMSTKRILMPAKTNGLLKVNLSDKPSFSDCKVVSTNVVDIGQTGSLQCNSTTSSPPALSILPTASSTLSLSLLPNKQQT